MYLFIQRRKSMHIPQNYHKITIPEKSLSAKLSWQEYNRKNVFAEANISLLTISCFLTIFNDNANQHYCNSLQSCNISWQWILLHWLMKYVTNSNHFISYTGLKHKCKITENKIEKGSNVINHNTVLLLNNQRTRFVAASRRWGSSLSSTFYLYGCSISTRAGTALF